MNQDFKSESSSDLIIARYEIDAAISDYAIGFDDRDPARFLAAFHDDAIFKLDFPAAILHGHKEILPFAEEAWQQFESLSHLTANHRIDRLNHTEATGIGHAMALVSRKDGPVILAAGRYSDRFHKRDGKWRIASREVAIVSQFTLADAQAIMLNGSAVVKD